MKTTILITAITILAFNMHTSHKKTDHLDIQGIHAYLLSIASKNRVSITNSFVPPDDTFVTHAIKANQQEIMMSQLALQNSTNPQIKSLAQKLINDHQQLLQQLKKLSNSGNQMSNMNDSATVTTDRNMAYNNLSGNEFDRQWISDMIIGHTKTIDEFNTELRRTQNADVRNLITQSLPAISEHLRQLEALRNKMM